MTYPEDPFEESKAIRPIEHTLAPNSIPDNYLVWTILSTIICCVPLGAVGIYFSSRVDRYLHLGQYDAARDASQKAMIFAIVAAVVGALFYIGLFLITVVFGTPTHMGY